ncbi:MAG: hypothetical protein A3J38_10375 [Gammaproteobacteria bacterium RIFCSPHIGHO2_12_FULL_45_9]|nr:MAG: hypothetical protein A3J38_10375 [Gammaproteobacteria bacterium RIFCSPHIGHO2_12_FULL_45_9]
MQYYLEQQMRKQKTAYHLAGIRYAESNLRQTMADHEQEIEPFYKMIRDRAPAETAALRLDPRDYAHEAGPLSYTDYTNWAKRILEKLQIFLRLAPTYLESEHKQDLITSVQSILDYKKAFFETDAKTYIGVNSIEPSTWARQSDLVANLEHHIPALSAESIVYSTGTMLPLVQKSYYMCYILEAISNLTPIGFASVSTTNLDQDPATAKLNLTVMPLGRPGIRFYYMHLYGTTVAHIIGIITHTTSRGRQEVLFFDPNYGVYSFSCVGAHTPPKKPITTFLKEFVTVHKYPGIYTDATVHSFECN